MINLIPRPVRDLVESPLNIYKLVQRLDKSQSGSGENAILGVLGARAIKANARNMIDAALRIAIAVAGVFIFANSKTAVALALGSMISIPATLIVGGACLLSYSLAAMRIAMVTGSLFTVGAGFAALVGGYLVLEKHDIYPFGVVEMAIDTFAELQTIPLAKALINASK